MHSHYASLVTCALVLTSCAVVPEASTDRPAPEASRAPPAVRESAPPSPVNSSASPWAATFADDVKRQNPNTLQDVSTARDRWPRVVFQGYFGAAFYELEGEGSSAQDADSTFPTIGGGAQWNMLGENNLRLGLEGLLAFGWQSNISAFASGGGGAAVAVNVDLLIIDLFGGPFGSIFLGENVRVYGGAGPLMQWATYDQDGPSSQTSGEGDGFGFGYYARTGIDIAITPNNMIGFGVRWSDATVDLSGGVNDVDVSGLQAMVTVTQGF